MSISVIIPTFNEEKYIQQAIDSAHFADEILIIDSYSNDKTVAIAKNNNCKVIQREFDNFSNQKNYAIEQAKNEWIMILDADELLLPKLQQEITNITKNSTEHIAFKIPRRNYFINKFLNFGSDGTEKITRIFQKDKCKYQGLVHEKLYYEGSTGVLKNEMYHFTYQGFQHFISKKNNYSNLQSEQLFHKNKKTNFFQIVFKPLFRFFTELILKKGIFDGVAGYTTTNMNAYGVLSRYIKLRTLQNKTKSQELINLDSFSIKMLSEATNSANKYSKSPDLFLLVLNPIFTFLKFYIMKGYFLKGIDGYALSYLQGFKEFTTLLKQWFNQRELE